MKFSITGGNGFVGVHLIHHLLRNGHEVTALMRAGSSLDEFDLIQPYYQFDKSVYSRLSWHECNYSNPVELDELFGQSDYVIHLAGSISYNQKDQNNLIHSNINLTADVVNAALRTKPKKIIYCSSIAALSKSNQDELIDESNEWDQNLPHSFYGYTKHMGELEIYRGIQEGQDAIIIIPGIILGYGDWTKGSNSLFKNAYREFPFYSKGVTGFVSVEDIAKIIEKMSLANIVNERFIVSSENLTYGEVSNIMADSFKKKRPRIEVKGILLAFIKWVVKVKKFLGLGGLITVETTSAAVSKNRFDNTKVIDAFDFQFESIESAIRNASKWYKKSPHES